MISYLGHFESLEGLFLLGDTLHDGFKSCMVFLLNRSLRNVHVIVEAIRYRRAVAQAPRVPGNAIGTLSNEDCQSKS